MGFTFSRYSPEFYHFLVLTLILPIFGIGSEVLWYLHKFYFFPVLARIPSFFGTDPDSTIFWYSFGLLFDTRPDYIIFRY